MKIFSLKFILSIVLMSFFAIWPQRAYARDDVVTLRIGERAIILFDNGTQPTVSIAALSEQEQSNILAWLMRAQGSDERTNDEGSLSQIKSREVRVSFLKFAPSAGREERILMIENGYDGTFRYHATIFRGEESAPTSVCAVLPQVPGVEHWPFYFDKIDLFDLSLTPDSEDDASLCG